MAIEHNTQPTQPEVVIEYGFSSGIKESIASPLTPIDAISELVDNSVGLGKDSEDPRSPLVVSVRMDKKAGTVRVTDYRGRGGNIDTLKDFLNKGISAREGYGRWGLGAAAAAFSLQCSTLTIRAEDGIRPESYEVTIDGYGDPTKPFAGSTAVRIHRDKSEVMNQPRFEVTMSGIPAERFPTESAVHKRVAELYGPLLISENEITPGNIIPEPQPRYIPDPVSEGFVARTDRVIIRVNGKIVEPQRFDIAVSSIANDMQRFSPENIVYGTTEEGEKVWFWAGRIPEDQSDRIRGNKGLQFYYKGRLIGRDDVDLFKKDDRFRALVGEVHLDNMIDLLSNTQLNKSVGINKDTALWKRVREFMQSALQDYGILTEITENTKPHIIETSPRLTDAIKTVQTTLNEVMASLVAADTDLAELLEARFGSTYGQRPPREKTDKKSTPRTKPTSGRESGTVWSAQKPRTQIPSDANPEIRRKRLDTIFDAIEVGHLEDPSITYQVIHTKDENSGASNRIFVLNANNPSYSTITRFDASHRWVLADRLLLYASEWLSQDYSSDTTERRNFQDRMYNELAQTMARNPKYKTALEQLN